MDSFENVTINFDPNRVAEIIFTSGSTALPKGVMLSHKNLIANTNSITRYLHLNEEDRIEVDSTFLLLLWPFSFAYASQSRSGSVVLNNMFFMINTVIDDIVKIPMYGICRSTKPLSIAA